MKSLFITIFFFIATWFVTAQPYVREVESIPVIAGGETLRLPWAGGINSPHIQFVDIDSDGDMDLFILDRDNTPNVVFFRNEGTPGSPVFRLRSNVIDLPVFTSWFLFVDITADGLVDLFTDDGATGMNYYRNQGTPQSPQFVLIQATMRDSAGVPINAGSYSIPAFADINADGKIDFFSGNIIGSINFYRNVGTPSNPVFRLITESWQNILFISGGSCCPVASVERAQAELHGASAMFFADIDNDNDYDFLLGDLYHTGVAFFRNQGNPLNPVMVLQDTCFPSNDPVCTTGGNQPFLVDIDGDGDKDLFVGVGVVSGAIVQRHTFLQYENVGTPSVPSFVKRTEDYLPMIDVGRSANPEFVDIDGDGKLDLFVGTTNGEIWYYRNIGTPTSPAFQLVDTAFAGISGGFTYAPTFCDIDADGDFDLFLGLFDGSMRFYRNIGSPTTPQFVREASPVDTIRVQYYNAPAFADIDNDGDLDLFVGGYNGRIKFYRNIGNPTNFVPVLESITYQNITAGQNSQPCFADIDADGDYDLFIGTSEGRVEYYQNTGTPDNAVFVRVTNHYASTDPMQEAVPAFADIDADGDLDLFVGNLTGGIHFYRNTLITSVAERGEVHTTFGLYQNYPNPFNPSTSIRFEVPSSGFVSLRVYNLLGQEVATSLNGFLPAGSHEVEFIAPHHIASGIYLYRLSFIPSQASRGRLFQDTRKFILLR